MTKYAAALFFLAAFGCSLAAPARAAEKKPIEFRRTLEASAGQQVLKLEAPRDMCFLDRTAPAEEAIYQSVQEDLRRHGGQFLLAVFMNCGDVAMVGAPSRPGSVPEAVGTIVWMNPSIGEKTDLSRADYLDMREASFLQYGQNNGQGLVPQGAARRTQNGVYLALSGTAGETYEKLKSSAILATTSLRHVPVEIMLRYNGASPPAAESLLPLMENLVDQQTRLNP